MADLNRRDRKLLRDAAELIDENAKSLRDCCTVGTRWDSASDRKVYEREARMARRLREMARG